MKLTQKMEQWIESRLWKKKLNNDYITIGRIVSELKRLLRITLTFQRREELEYKIKQIRSRIFKRHQRLCHCRDDDSETYEVPRLRSVVLPWQSSAIPIGLLGGRLPLNLSKDKNGTLPFIRPGKRNALHREGNTAELTAFGCMRAFLG